jgi:acylphosphatase
VAEGEAEKLDSLINWAKSGSPSAVVNNLKTKDKKLINLKI